MNEAALRDLIDSFVGAALGELEFRLKAWPTDFSKIEVHEVLGALLARQVTLATQLAECPPIWNGHIAPILLRAMADVHITVAWILKDPMGRSRQFIRYGLGQAKLNLEHRKAKLDMKKPDPEQQRIVEAIEGWINAQRFTWLTEVNLGSWSGKNVREMADEADCLDFYYFVYSSFSLCAHSTWEHIEKYNLQKCQNPMHRYHRVSIVADVPLDPHYLYLAGKYLNKTLRVFDGAVGTTGLDPSVFDLLCTKLTGRGEGSSEEQANNQPPDTAP